MTSEIGRRVRRLWWALVLTTLAAWCLVLLVVTIAGAATVLVSVGVVLLLAVLPFVRRISDAHRAWAADRLGVSIPSPYHPLPKGNMLIRLWAYARDPATRRDIAWLAVNGTAGLVVLVVAIVETVLAVLFWWLPGDVLLGVHARIARALLSPSEAAQLQHRVRQLAESRAETVDTQAAEIRRIERDLHDGAQARLVALGLNLGMAEAAMDDDPGTARALLAEARAASSQALSELRGLVRGIHPPVLADRGLVGAVEALVLATPLPVDITADVPERLSAPVESAGYFAVAEALTNVVRHSGATRAWVTLTVRDDLLHMTVRDDGRGGAAPDAGSGLRGIARRLGAFDGKLTVHSPRGGPTELTMELPCATSALVRDSGVSAQDGSPDASGSPPSGR